MTRFNAETFKACPVRGIDLLNDGAYEKFLDWEYELDCKLKELCLKILDGECDAVAFSCGSTSYLLTRSTRPGDDIQLTKFYDGLVVSHLSSNYYDVDGPQLQFTEEVKQIKDDIEFVCCSELGPKCDIELEEQFGIHRIDLCDRLYSNSLEFRCFEAETASNFQPSENDMLTIKDGR